MSFEALPEESVLWEGELLPPMKLSVVSIALLLFVFLAVQGLVVAGTFLLSKAAIVDAIVAVGIGLALLFLRGFRAVRFYITNKRIVRTRGFHLRPLELRLDLVREVLSNRIRGKGYVSFVPALRGHHRIVFGPFKDDPEKIREIALRARSNLATRP